MKKLNALLLFIILFTSITFAQSYKEHRGDVYYNRFDYNKAMELYLEVIKTDSNNYRVMAKLAEGYKFISNDTASANWYKKLLKSERVRNIDYYNYSMVLKNIGKYDEAGEMLLQYSKHTGSKRYLLNKEYVDEIKNDDFLVTVSLIEKSSAQSDFSPAYFGNKIIFVSSRQGTGVLKNEYVRNGEAFLQLYIADTLPNGQLDSIKLFSKKINTRFHEGPVSYCEFDSTMYFTRDNYKFFKGFSTDGIIKLKIYQSKFTYNDWLKWMGDRLNSIGINSKLNKEDWRTEKEHPVCNNEFSVGHPTITKDGKKMYFTSNKPDGKGGSDIYVSRRIEGNEWSEPMNIRSVNTEGDEMFPYISDDGTLYFASTGWPGMGGLDIFKAKSSRGGFRKPVNMGAPLNSTSDDFGLIVSHNKKTGYFSSNRPGGNGSDDLYHVKFETRTEYPLSGVVTEKATGQPIPDAIVEVIDNTTQKKMVVITDEKGKYLVTVSIKSNYTINCKNSLYIPYSSQFEPKSQTIYGGTMIANIELGFYGVFGSVFKKGTKEKIPFVEIYCKPDNSNQILSATTDSLGDFKIVMGKDIDYKLLLNKNGFFTFQEKYSTKGKPEGWTNINEFVGLYLDKIEVNKAIEIPNIYYDMGKYNIRPDAAVELDKIVVFLNTNPNIHVELGSHTDSRGSAKTNKILSQKRAQAAVNYIVKHGIDSDRISAKGYGETKLKNRCGNGVKCSEEEHQQNRRTEIRVTSLLSAN